jgi:hypothetical protein
MNPASFPEQTGKSIQLTFDGTSGETPIFFPGLLCQEQKGLRSKSIRGSKETALVSMIRTYVPIFDPHDVQIVKVPTGKKGKDGNYKYKRENKVKARLMDEGQGFLLLQPKVPHAFSEKLAGESKCRDFSKKLIVSDVVEAPNQRGAAKEDTLLTANNSLGTNLWAKAKLFSGGEPGVVVTGFLFPQGYTCNNARFNFLVNTSDELTLEVKPHFDVCTFIWNGVEFGNVQGWAVIDAAVDEELQNIDESDSSEGYDSGGAEGETDDGINIDPELLQSFKRMSVAVAENKNKKRLESSNSKRAKAGEDAAVSMVEDL